MFLDVLRLFLYDPATSIYYTIFSFVEEMCMNFVGNYDYEMIEYITVLFTTLTALVLTAILIYLVFKGIYMIVRWLVQW